MEKIIDSSQENLSQKVSSGKKQFEIFKEGVYSLFFYDNSL